MSFNGASFRAGPHSEVLVTVSAHSYFIVLKVFCIQDAALSGQHTSPCVISQIRQRFDAGIQYVLKRACPSLLCSVCVSPCRNIFPNFHLNHGCLERLGTLGNVAKNIAVCFKHGEYLSYEKFKCWFCETGQQSSPNPDYEHRQLLKDHQKLQNLAQKVCNVSTMKTLGLALGLPNEKIEACNTNASTDIELATSNMLFIWFNRERGSLENGTKKDRQLTRALEDIGLANYA